METDRNKAAESGSSSSVLFAFEVDEHCYTVKDRDGVLRMIMLRGIDDQWRMHRLDTAEAFDRDQYRHDLLERNGVPTSNILYEERQSAGTSTGGRMMKHPDLFEETGSADNAAGAGCSAAICSASVLDMCCGPRMMWFDKQDSRAVYLDRRRERHAMNRPKRGTVEWTETDPDILCDFTDMPFEDGSFDHVVFDPPHFERSGKIGFLAMKYGWLDGDWREMIRAGFKEGFRVLRPGGTLIFKWTATENPVSEILKLTPMKPLYGHKSGKQQQTHWIAFHKPNDQAEARLPNSAASATKKGIEQ